jgi:hypothetical protein
MTYMHHRHSVCQFTATTLEIPFATTEVSNPGKRLYRNPTTGREPISEDRSNHRGVEGGSEELNIPAKLEQR